MPKKNCFAQSTWFHRFVPKEIAQRPQCAEKGWLGSDGFDTRTEDDASPFLIQRTETLLRLPSLQTNRENLGSATEL